MPILFPAWKRVWFLPALINPQPQGSQQSDEVMGSINRDPRHCGWADVCPGNDANCCSVGTNCFLSLNLSFLLVKHVEEYVFHSLYGDGVRTTWAAKKL